GQFNFYLEEESRWDAWISGTNLDTGPLTAQIVPEHFYMEGRLSLNLISEGVGLKLGKTTGEFLTETPGHFDITRLDETIERLPAGWNQLKTSLAELGLSTLKRFDYEQGAGSLSLDNREGDFLMRFVGPYGSREVNIFLHDERNTPAAPLVAQPVAP
ncbi:MAG: hypothetical protein AAF236_11280, partial [Verrucomicrobiota bacterium]